MNDQNMPPLYLSSIKEIVPEDCFNTQGSQPVKVYCSNGQDYVCKYFTGVGAANGLFNEYLAVCFGKLWHLQVQDFSIVQVQKHHVKMIAIPKRYFDIPCFGSLYGRNLKEVDKFFLGWPSRMNRMDTLVMDYLKIGLFDIWLSNDDRNFDNFNLLYAFETDHLIPIDHVQIFNGNNLDKEPYLISDTDSILTSPFMNGIFYRTLQQNFKEFRLTLQGDFNSHIQRCNENLDTILHCTPPEWCLDKAQIHARLQFYFSDEWQNQCLETFDQFVHISLNRKP